MAPQLCALSLAADAKIPAGIHHYLQANNLRLETFDEKAHYLWDNWGAWDPEYRIFHRYSQTASTRYGLSAQDKSAHNEAGIRHFVSEDGKIWYHVGIALEKKHPNELAYWSGKTLIHDGQYYLFHTRGESSGQNQYIALSVSADGHRFSKSSPVLKPLVGKRYVYDDSDGAIPAWRDPEVFWNASTHCWMMLFATKVSSENEGTRAGIGLASSVDLQQWNLLPPLNLELPEDLKRSGLQLELPNIYAGKEKNRLYVSYSVPGSEGVLPRAGAIYWDFDKLGEKLRDAKVLLEDPGYYGLSVVAGQFLFLFSTDKHANPYRMANLDLD